MHALFDDVLVGDELAGCARAQLLHGQAGHHLLILRGCNLPRSGSSELSVGDRVLVGGCG